MANSAAERQQSLVDLEDLYVWLQQFEDPSIGNGKCLKKMLVKMQKGVPNPILLVFPPSVGIERYIGSIANE